MMNKIKLIEETFKTINKVTNGRFSTLRNLDLIPESSSLENDIDLLIPSVYVKQVVEAVKSSSYQIYQDNSPCLYGAHPHIHFKHSNLDVHFDIMTGMYYRSVANNTAFVNIDKRLTRSALDNAVTVDKVYIKHLSTNDELVHLVCHCIFDKRETTDKYQSRILELVDKINPPTVHKLMSMVFYKATDLIYSKVLDKDVKNLFNDYITFKDY